MSEKNLVVDTVSSSLVYIGEAAIAVTQATAFWKIKRITTTGSIVQIVWADGNENFDNVWNNRASLSYA